MAYVLEAIKPIDQEKIVSDADEMKRSHLQMRGGHFNEEVQLVWAIDRERDMYLLGAPTFESRSPYAYFYFHFNSVLYGFRINKSRQEIVQFDDMPHTSILAQFQKELTEAFAVHRFCGLPDQEPPFVPTFKSIEV